MNRNLLFLFALFGLFGMASAAGAYNYNVTINIPHQSIPIGETLYLTGFVGYNGSQVREYPCLFTIYDWKDSHVIEANRFYTDELGQFSYPFKMSDAFLYNNNYTYILTCSNGTANGTVYAKTAAAPRWFLNSFIFGEANSDWLIIFAIILGLVLAAIAVYVYMLPK